jgi:hypothetical protein
MKLQLFLEMAAAAFPERIAIGSRKDGMPFQKLLASSQNVANWMTSKVTQAAVYCGFNDPALPLAVPCPDEHSPP